MYFQRVQSSLLSASQMYDTGVENAVFLRKQTLKACPPLALSPRYARPAPLQVAYGKETEVRPIPE